MNGFQHAWKPGRAGWTTKQGRLSKLQFLAWISASAGCLDARRRASAVLVRLIL